MSRSTRKTPIFPNASNKGEKKDKRRAQGAERSAARARIATGDPESIEPVHETHPRSGRALFSKDGKHWWQKATKKDMRK
jgi:hypothetical protein